MPARRLTNGVTTPSRVQRCSPSAGQHFYGSRELHRGRCLLPILGEHIRSRGDGFIILVSCLAHPLKKAGKPAVMVSALLTQWSPQRERVSAGFGRKS